MSSKAYHRMAFSFLDLSFPNIKVKENHTPSEALPALQP